MALVKTSLIYFDRAVREGSIRRAAEKLHVASSAVNRQLLLLEEEMGVELFVRLPRGIRPTAAGEALLSAVRRWQNEASQVRLEINRLKGGVRGTIRVAAAESITADIVPRAMATLNAQFPLVDFTLISGDNLLIRSALLEEDADIVCAFDIAAPPGSQTVCEVSGGVGVLTPPDHPLAGKAEVTLTECLRYPVVAPNAEWLNHSILHKLFERRDLDLRIAARVERIGMLKNLVHAGVGIAFLSRFGLARDVAEGRFAWVPLAGGQTPPATVSLLIPRGRVLAPYIQVFIDLLREELERSA